MPEILLIKSDFERGTQWRDAFAHSDLEIRDWHHPEAKQADYALVWQPPPGALAALPRLKLIFSIGAGLDHLVGDDLVPPGIPIIRMVEDTLTAGMTEFIVYNTLHFHRFMPQYEADQRACVWHERLQTPAQQRRIGFLGFGVLGQAAAKTLLTFGFDIAAWSRTKKHIPGIASFHGTSQLPAFLARTDIAICLLPLTPDTAGILNTTTFAHLPRGAFLINAGRGGHCVEPDLLAALDSGQLAGAALDVFHQEPLPADSPLWRHPRLRLTPHIASMTLPATSALHVIDNIRRFRAGRPLTHTADLTRGY